MFGLLTSFAFDDKKSKSQLLAEFDRPKVVIKTPEQITAEKESYIQIVLWQVLQWKTQSQAIFIK